MADYANAEFQRILSNPGNEIISDSLKERLRPVSQPIVLFLSFDDDNFECSLDSFCVSDDLTSISISLNNEAALSLLSKKAFVIKCEIADLDISSSSVSSYNCFKYDSDTYILELEMLSKEVLSD